MQIEMQRIQDTFEDRGYYLAKRIYEGDMLAAMATDFDRIVAQLLTSGEDVNARWNRAEPGTTVVHTHNVQQYSAIWLRALLHEPFLDVARAILGADIVLHHTKLFLKFAEEGASFPMHQDWSYFPTERDTMIAGVIHLSEATDEMGCLRVYPGSHKRGRLSNSSGQEDSAEMREFPMEAATVVEAEPGDVLFFHYCLVHGSPPNRSKTARKTVLVQMHAGDDRIEEGVAHPYEGLVLSGWNAYATRTSANRKSR